MVKKHDERTKTYHLNSWAIGLGYYFTRYNSDFPKQRIKYVMEVHTYILPFAVIKKIHSWAEVIDE